MILTVTWPILLIAVKIVCKKSKLLTAGVVSKGHIVVFTSSCQFSPKDWSVCIVLKSPGGHVFKAIF